MKEHKVEDIEATHDWILCGQRSNCSATWDSLTFKQKMKLENKFDKTGNKMQKAIEKTSKKINKEFKKA